MEYAGHDWVEASLKIELTVFQKRVADIIGFVWRGIYHLPAKRLRAAFEIPPAWDGVELLVFDELSTWDFNKLTELVVLCHDQCIRLSVGPANPRYLRLLFHPREREGSTSQRHPTIEQAIEAIRERAQR